MQPTEDDRQFLQQTARLCDGRFIPAPIQPAAELCTKPSAANMPAEYVWSAKDTRAGSLPQLPAIPAVESSGT